MRLFLLFLAVIAVGFLLGTLSAPHSQVIPSAGEIEHRI